MKTVWIVNQYASTPENGMGGRSYYLGKELAKMGYQVYLIASSSNHLLHKKIELNESVKIENLADGLNFVLVNMPDYDGAHSKQRVLNWFLFSWRIQKLAKIIKDKPDAILCSSPSLIAFLGAERLSRKFKSRLIFEVRDIWPLTLTEIGGYSSKHPFIRLMQWVEDRAYRNADIVVSNLKNSVDHMVSRGMERYKFSWIPNGFSLDEINQAKELDDKILIKLPKEKFLVGYVGTFGLANDLVSVLKAASHLKEFRDIAFVFVGGGKDKGYLLKLSSDLELDNVYFLDFIEKKQVQSILKYFDAVLVGAKKHPMYRFGVSPNKLFDYLASAKPIIYHIESANYHPVNDAKCGIQVEPENPNQLAQAVLTLYQLPESQRVVMGGNGRRVALEQYEYGQLSEKLADVLFGNT